MRQRSNGPFADEEVEAIAVGVRMVRRLPDDNLHRAAENVLSKITLALPPEMQKAQCLGEKNEVDT